MSQSLSSASSSGAPQRVRTRFAPSPTGFIHLGNIRSALYPWAFARATGGDFILRIEDTDVERSSQAAVDVILEGMQWLGMEPDEGPFYQMQRMDRYKEVLAQMQAQGLVYPCYMSVAELDALRERQMQAKQKPRYDGTWRPEEGKTLPPVPEGVQPVLRFRNPVGGSVVWEDKVKGRIEIQNDELDDLVIARPDGTPTYNFCVVVDDIDMAITHVIRGDDHVNNTPRQINIFRALGKEPPVYAHLPTVLNEQGEKMSKRNGAKPVTQYRDEGYLPEAMVNYLARLGWSHGDDEIFSREQFLEWFDLDHLGRSAAQFDEAKLRWVNAQHLKATADERLAELVAPRLAARGIAQSELADGRLPRICALFKDRCDTLVALADWAHVFYGEVTPNEEERAKHVVDAVKPAIAALSDALAQCAWDKASIAAAFKEVLAAQGLKMPQLAMPVRVLTVGTAHTPSVDAVLELLGREKIAARLRTA
ncbi:glutamate--tRNA ligase [Paracidovorax citrulli]|uniref:Glutamate--tRNA ligase n=2 Tax=Paracidovorax citrulli TaxID=80869 RepID=SYE_PARC0|nr:glutamate--tRNA ligase [Paracidovorax citrulli]A1TNB1.1 RecName: Full=Glutamate--tRNA ligase; AltName: Full=Glutamyl-tRNA synthetase; Short=GluRS [Paracidovorax citrulli AAC00-1]ABM32449.1 glutamyl-tRNA synthetase [Paracidovorax citrulli AAC00-1]ATG94541.1 glutamate--tRNA ligase [Paracidovorax citrulli]PVY66665.1 glutamyl-tRNA synthetase [Paracidovorax citrulli]QCX12294.1 Glutamate--tRNA ligase [Paracidovorax citrulli]REG69168.1 glutamyl-tRNA synthetase [Paracidovorax citrulli]